MIICRYCETEFESKDITFLEIRQPNRSDPHYTIQNTICPECRDKVWKALAECELNIIAQRGVQI